MRIGLFGATGFIGSALASALIHRGDEVIRYSRHPRGEGWRSSEGELDLDGLEVVVNLAGESVAQRWTKSIRGRIYESRVGLTTRIVQAMKASSETARPRALLNASAIGYYGPRGEASLTEDAEPGTDYLAKICQDWENAAWRAQDLGVRVVLLRTGIVLGAGGTAWERVSRVFRLGMGGRLGDGRQWMPWIHLSDELQAILYLLDHPDFSGPVNLVAPEVVRNREWTQALAQQLNRPAFLPVPGVVLKIVLGDFAETILASYRVVPERLRSVGYSFLFPDFPTALEDLFKDPRQ